MDLRVADSEARQKYTKCHSTVRKYLDKASKYKYNGNKSSWDRKCHDNMFYLESASDVRMGDGGKDCIDVWVVTIPANCCQVP